MVEGPVYIYALGFLPLLIRFAAYRPWEICWHTAARVRGDSPDLGFTFWKATRLLPHAFDKLRVRDSLRSFMYASSLPAPRRVIVKVPTVQWANLFRRWCALVLRPWRRIYPEWAGFVAAGTSVMVISAMPLKRVCHNSAKTVDSLDLGELGSVTNRDLEIAAKGIDLEKLEAHGRLPTHFSPAECSNMVATACKDWLRNFKLPKCFERTLNTAAWGGKAEQSKTIVHSTAGRIASTLTGQHGLTTLVADKDPNTLWLCSSRHQLLRWLGQFAGAEARWRIFCPEPVQIVRWYQTIIDFVLPRSLCPKSTMVALGSIPYMYPTLKQKCWSDSMCNETQSKHTCKKPGHSCMRNVVSFFRLPVRKTMKGFTRAYSHLTRVFVPGWSLGSLNTAYSRLIERVGFLKPPVFDVEGKARCIRCNVHMLKPTLLVGDAGQAYEVLDLGHVEKANEYIYSKKRNLLKTLVLCTS